MKKVNDGYRCDYCGDIFNNANKCRSHQRNCGLQSLNQYLDDVKNISSLDIPEQEEKESKQLFFKRDE